MVEILQNKNLATRFQILVEIADKGPNIKQQDIARRLKITPQAVSDYIRQLLQEGLLTSEGRSKYRVTINAVNWIIKVMRELKGYSEFIGKVITNISVSTAVASSNLSKGQPVGLEMRDGWLIAVDKPGNGASGIVVSRAKQGEDVGITNVKGIIQLTTGRVTILRVPGIQKGGSRKVDLNRLQAEIRGKSVIAVIGIEALIALKQTDTPFYYIYGATEAVVEAAERGLNPVVACVDNETANLLQRLEKETIDYQLLDIEKVGKS
ncbi:MAG: winged helix-turn-helix transcriptional regulator [Dehalococcoidales bacterium]|nr:winged helix-turn-helix transcriptional regulator [Dehalococcoidales bacterium]